MQVEELSEREDITLYAIPISLEDSIESYDFVRNRLNLFDKSSYIDDTNIELKRGLDDL